MHMRYQWVDRTRTRPLPRYSGFGDFLDVGEDLEGAGEELAGLAGPRRSSSAARPTGAKPAPSSRPPAPPKRKKEGFFSRAKKVVKSTGAAAKKAAKIQARATGRALKTGAKLAVKAHTLPVTAQIKAAKLGLKLAKKIPAKKVAKFAIKAQLAPVLLQAKAAKAGAKLAAKGIKRGVSFVKKHPTKVLAAVAPGAAATLLAVKGAKALKRKFFGPKLPPAVEMPNGEVIDPEEIEAASGVPAEAVSEAAIAVNNAADEDEAQELVDEIEERYGLEDEALQPLADSAGEDEGEDDAGDEEESDEGEEDESEEDAEISGIKSKLKAAGRGLKKAGKAVGKAVGKGAVAGAKIAGRTIAAKYGLVLGGGGSQQPAVIESGGGGGRNLVPWVAGGAALLGLGYFVLRRR